MDTRARARLLLAATKAEAKSDDPTRHKCFVSYHADDADEVTDFIDDFGHVFIPRVIGVSDEDDFIDSSDVDYVMDCIREKYLTDSTVTIVLVGKCTWARRYVDWEIYSTLRNDKKNRRSGLMAVTLPSAADYWNSSYLRVSRTTGTAMRATRGGGSIRSLPTRCATGSKPRSRSAPAALTSSTTAGLGSCTTRLAQDESPQQIRNCLSSRSRLSIWLTAYAGTETADA
jgi:hypothetical protein